jgi:orotate phosphoribosyltransferase
MHPHLTERLCKALAERIREEVSPAPDYVVGPAIGGLIPAYETSRHLGAPAIWVERENGVFRLRRFEISPGDRVVIVEDIVTTGLSIRETVECLRGLGAEVLAAACIIDRSAGKVDVGVPLIALAEYEVPAYPADALPPELAAIPPVKPGSRNL